MTGTATLTSGMRLHALEHLLVEPALARRHLQLRLPGDAVDRLVEARTARDWLAVCMPTNTATPSTMPGGGQHACAAGACARRAR